jgi:hypothetical protein
MSSSGDADGRGRLSWHFNGRPSKLSHAPNEPGDEQQGGWPREKLISMNDCFVAAVERAHSTVVASTALQRKQACGQLPAMAIGWTQHRNDKARSRLSPVIEHRGGNQRAVLLVPLQHYNRTAIAERHAPPRRRRIEPGVEALLFDQ